MITWYCFSLTSKLAAGYDDMKKWGKNGAGFVILPSRTHVHDYKNYIQPHNVILIKSQAFL